MNINISIPRVRQMSSRSGSPVANQFEISINSVGTFFQSYSSIIAAKTPEGIILDEYYWDYSRTTGKYRNQFLNENIAETRAKIKSGEYKLANLN